MNACAESAAGGVVFVESLRGIVVDPRTARRAARRCAARRAGVFLNRLGSIPMLGVADEGLGSPAKRCSAPRRRRTALSSRWLPWSRARAYSPSANFLASTERRQVRGHRVELRGSQPPPPWSADRARGARSFEKAWTVEVVPGVQAIEDTKIAPLKATALRAADAPGAEPRVNPGTTRRGAWNSGAVPAGRWRSPSDG